MKFDPLLSYVIDSLTTRIEETNDPRLRKALALVEDVAMGRRRRWWRIR
jgi:hypothetical protein